MGVESITVDNKAKKREELRLTNPPKHLYDFVVREADINKRSVPKQLEFIIDEYYKKIWDKKAIRKRRH